MSEPLALLAQTSRRQPNARFALADLAGAPSAASPTAGAASEVAEISTRSRAAAQQLPAARPARRRGVAACVFASPAASTATARASPTIPGRSRAAHAGGSACRAAPGQRLRRAGDGDPAARRRTWRASASALAPRRAVAHLRGDRPGTGLGVGALIVRDGAPSRWRPKAATSASRPATTRSRTCSSACRALRPRFQRAPGQRRRPGQHPSRAGRDGRRRRPTCSRRTSPPGARRRRALPRTRSRCSAPCSARSPATWRSPSAPGTACSSPADWCRRLLDESARSAFRRRFEAKGRFAGAMARCPRSRCCIRSRPARRRRLRAPGRGRR
jgi:hypothetical protein